MGPVHCAAGQPRVREGAEPAARDGHHGHAAVLLLDLMDHHRDAGVPAKSAGTRSISLGVGAIKGFEASRARGKTETPQLNVWLVTVEKY